MRAVGAAISDAAAQRRKMVLQVSRQRNLATIAEVAAHFLSASPVVQRIIEEEGPLVATSPSLGAILTVKSNATLLRRTCSIRLYRAWFATAGLQSSTFFSEPSAYRYFRFLFDDRAPATRAAGMHQAFLFLGGLFELPLEAFLRSARLRGLTVMNLRTRAEIRQSAPLKVAMVKALEKCVLDDDGRGDPAALLAGAALFVLFARARVGDAARCIIEPLLDTADGHGYIETKFELHKTARPGTRAMLPISANAFGLLGKSWASTWLKARAAAGLSAGRQYTLLPVAAESGWHDVAMNTTEFAAQLRSLILDLGFSVPELERIGAHSLKCTCLAWSAKFGIDKEQRRLLGYHMAPGDRTLEAYSRDAMATPLRGLDQVLSAIAAGSFDPDATRSGAFRAQLSCSYVSALSAAGVGELSPAPEDPSRAAACARGVEEVDLLDASGSEAALSATAPAAEESADDPRSPASGSSTVSSASPVASSDDVDADADLDLVGEIILNTDSGKYHLDAGDGRLRDGKPYPKQFVRVSAIPAGGRLCTRCF